jgi:hypothetical protein
MATKAKRPEWETLKSGAALFSRPAMPLISGLLQAPGAMSMAYGGQPSLRDSRMRVTARVLANLTRSAHWR